MINKDINKDEILIQVKNLQVSFKRRKKAPLYIIRGVDITIKRGQIIGLVGESGSGKSVTTKAFINVNFDDITSFDSFILFDQKFKEHKQVQWKKDALSGQIAYIPQNPATSMNPSRKIKNHIYDILKVHAPKLKTVSQKKAKTIQLLKRFKMVSPENVLNLYPHELSGGMKQRIIIAMSIMSGAKVIIADEPTTALDTTIQSSVLNLLQEINKEMGISIIFISHDIAVVAKMCSYIYVMYAGRIVEKAPKDVLFTNAKHPYTWALMSAIPENKNKETKLYAIEGTPPNMALLPPGDPFASRNKFAVAVDFRQEPPLFEVSQNHYAATWTLHPSYPKLETPKEVQLRMKEFQKVFEGK